MANNPRSSDKFVRPTDYPASQSSYALSGKIMLTAIVILFSVVVIMVCLHLYARWYLLRTRRRNLLLRNSRRRTHLVFHAVDLHNPAALQSTRGLDASVLKSLPVFNYSSMTCSTEELLECAVCLSEFEEGEKGRTLPKCNHSFHIECIDMWFQSHSTCPICRSPVEPVVSSDVVVKVYDEPEHQIGSSSGATCQHGEEQTTTSTTSSSSFRARRKEMIGVSEIEIPTRRNESFGRSENESPMSQYRSPGNRIRSLKRILSRSGMNSPSSGPNNEEDLERGKEDSMSQRGRVQTPRSLG